MDHPRYHDLSSSGGDPRENTAYFVLDSLLKSRIECGFESNAQKYDEDVNVYLVHLLSSLVSNPDLGQLAAERDIDVFDKIRECTDPRFKCTVYRTNADHLLVSTGIFTDSPYVEREGQRIYGETARDRIGRGKAYYHYASTLQERLAASSPVVARILAHLSQDFERYVDVLFHMRGEYFHLYERFKEVRFMSLQQDLSKQSVSGSDGTDLSSLRDDFLDAYWLWHKSPDATTRNSLIESVKRLRAADSSFDYQLPEH